MPKIRKTDSEEEVLEQTSYGPEQVETSEKEHLLALYEELKFLNVRSISDLEVLISRL